MEMFGNIVHPTSSEVENVMEDSGVSFSQWGF